MNTILNLIKDPVLTYEQKVIGLAREAENSLNVLTIDSELQALRDQGIICDLFEGSAPYRPRYIVPDYELLMKKGCQFLNLDPPKTLDDAILTLMIFYRHVPSITSFPVYIGNLDTLLEPFIENEEESLKAIKRLLTYVDRTLTDSFCHCNIGPLPTRAGRLILQAERELENAIPNLTLKVSHETTDAFLKDAVQTALLRAKPSFANHDMFIADLKAPYGIVSCYNGLRIGGGSHTLVRMRLDRLAKTTDSFETYINELLPKAALLQLQYMQERIRFLVEEVKFFETHFLAKEGFISLENFSAMFGIVGLAEAVNHFIATEDPSTHFGHSKEADALGLQIIATLSKLVTNYKAPYVEGSEGHFMLHAQVGIDSDIGTSPGCRIPIGEEPELHQHILQSAPFHKYFPSGIGDIFNFDQTALKNPEAIVDIIKGSFKSGLRYFSAYSTECDVIRITGYLVKRSDIEKLKKGEQVLNDAVVLGQGAVDNHGIYSRKIRSNAVDSE